MRAIFVFALFCGISSAGVFGQWCSVDPHNKNAERIFAKTGRRQPWKEYKSLPEVPELSPDDGIFAELWSTVGRQTEIRTDEPGEDFESHTNYCFDKAGQLTGVEFELRTGWGWGYKLDGRIEKQALHTISSEFFNTMTEKPVVRPETADDIKDALKPTLYLNLKKLPFYTLLAAPSK